MKAKKIIAPQEPGWDLDGDNSSHDDPLLDCLVQLAKLHNHPVSRTTLSAGLPLVNERLTVELFSRAADRADLAARVLKRPLKKISELELPAILLLDDRRACIALHIDEQQENIQIIRPESGLGSQDIPLSTLKKSYSGHAIFVRPKYHVEKKSVNPPGARTKNWFWGTLFSSWRIYRDVLLASFFINIFGLATPCFILNVYDRVIPNAAFETLWVLAIGIGIIYLFEILMRQLRGYFIDEAGKKSNLKMSALLFEKVLSLKLAERPKSVGSFTKQLQQFESIRDFFTSLSITALVDLPFSAIGLLAIWYIAGKMVLIQIVTILLMLLYAVLIQIPLKKSVKKTYHASAQKNAILVEGISGLETIKVLGAESQAQRAWEEAVSYISRWSARSRFLSSSVTNLSNFIQNFAVVCVVITGVYMVANRTLSTGGLIACVILSRRSIAPMGMVVSLATRFNNAKTSLKTLNKIMALPSERPPGKTFLHRGRFAGGIELKNMTFRYKDNAKDTLKNISLRIKPGEKLGIIGSIGCGKTTLGKLLLGLYEPTSGMVAMDGIDIRQIDPAELRHFIGYVPQDVTLFQGSIRDNIVMGTYDTDDATVLRAAKMAGVTDFVEKNPMGYDFKVVEQGRNLSGGQRQSIAIARSLLLDPPILVMDEPTSSMDNRSESRIKKRLASFIQDKTMIIITHRTSLLDLVDRIVVIDNETIIADGTKSRVLEALQSGQLTI